MPDDDAATAENKHGSGNEQVEGVMTRARSKGRKDRKRYREDSDVDKADVDDEWRQDVNEADSAEDFM